MSFLARTTFIGFALSVAAAGFFLFRLPHQLTLVIPDQASTSTPVSPAAVLQGQEEATVPVPAPAGGKYADIEPAPRLSDPPQVVKGIYVTGWIAGYQSRMDKMIELVDQTELNAMVIDVKDFSGYLSYPTDVPAVKEAGADREPRFVRPNALLKKLHDHGIYVIARVSVFEDSVFAKAHPEWALKTADGKLWGDQKGLFWMDPANKDVWDYEVAVAKDAFARGFDEVNFDYVRFPTDGATKAIVYPTWDGVTPKEKVIGDFWKYLREALPGEKISADLFGLTTVAEDDLGIGQDLSNAYGNFDAVAPMVYPSHYGTGFQGFKSPAQHPYEVIKYSMEGAVRKFRDLTAATSSPAYTTKTLLRPWLQAFDLGAVYSPDMIRQEIKAVDDAVKTAAPEFYGGWLLWDPNVRYVNYRDP
jgi:hypothetical protein